MEGRSITIRNARIGFKNFAGKPGIYNKDGDRNFVVFLDDSTARRLADQKYNVKELKPREEGDSPTPYIQVKVSYRYNPPKIVLVAGQKKSELHEDTLNVLDWSDVDFCDLTITPSSWKSPDGRNGVTAYLKTLYANLVVDELDTYYSDDQSALVDDVGGCGNCDECTGACGNGPPL